MSLLPRTPLLNPDLQRPDWQRTAPREWGPLWLDKNENLDPDLLGVTTSILNDLDPTILATYPDCGELYRKLGRWLAVGTDSLLLTPGSDGAIRLTFEAFVSEGDRVVHTLPTFAMYPVYCKMFGADVRPLTYTRGSHGPELPVARILEHIESVRPRLVCLPNPDSPTGTVIAPADMQELVALCHRLDAVVLIDEAYHPFYDQTVVPLTSQYPNLIVARTFAKAWGLAGLRIGYAVGHPDTIKILHKLRPMYEVSTLSIAFMERMLDHTGAMYESVRRLNDGKRHFIDSMTALGFETLLANGNFCHVAFGAHADAVHGALEGKVLYRKDFSEPCLKGFSRFSATTVDGFAPIIHAVRTAIGRQDS